MAELRGICASLRTLGDEATLLVQSGKPVGVLRTASDAPRVLIANSKPGAEGATWRSSGSWSGPG